MKDKKDLGFCTKAIHIGSEPDRETGAVIPPIYQTSTYVQASPGLHKGYEYTRSHNPTRTRLEKCLASLECAEYAVVTASGLSATMLIINTLAPNTTVLCGDDVYGGTARIFNTVFKDRHTFKFVDTTNLVELEKNLKWHKPQLLWLETPTNPTLKITDLAKACALAKKYNVLTVVDNTFMSPYFQNPINLGADVVLHSLTKFINGHSDVVGGAIMLNDKAMYSELWRLQNSIGPCQSPFDSWLVLRGVKTLGIRMEAHQSNAIKLAKYLENHSKVEKVIYPGLTSHPQYKLAKKQMSGFGGMITFYLKGNLRDSSKFLSNLEIFSLAESLGGIESLIEHPAIMTHASIPPERRKLLGISDNLIRISVGIENYKDLEKDLEQSFKKLGSR
ncbi:MAG: PLP-dependent aspartate aminotransferase family protein [Bacteriovoracaceae bacterium]